MKQYDFSGRTVLITGAARGFGARTAARFFDAGSNLVLGDLNDELLAQALEPYRDHGDRVSGLSGDVGEEDTARRLVELAGETHGGLDIAVNNAGIAHGQLRLEDIDGGEAADVVRVDLLGVFHAMKHQVPAMRQRHETTGRDCAIVNVASAAGLMGAPMLSVYAAAKHGVVGLTRSAALENARRGIRINAVCPAFARTDMLDSALQDSKHGPEEAYRRLVAGVPMQRVGEVDEVVQAILWACDEANSFFTGQTIAIDGGLTAF